jgi:hypothetical protein
VLILPAIRAVGTEWERALDVPDLIDDGKSVRVRAEYAVGIGRRTPIADQELAFVRDGSVVARAFSRDGESELASGLGKSLGVVIRPVGNCSPRSKRACRCCDLGRACSCSSMPNSMRTIWALSER